MFRVRRTTSSFGLPEYIFLGCLALLVALALYWLSRGRLPLPGTASVVMAVIATGLSFYTGIKQWQKGLSIGILALLLWVELKAIRSDRAKSDAKALADKNESNAAALTSRKQQDISFGKVFSAQQKDFLETERHLRSVITNDQNHFMTPPKE